MAELSQADQVRNLLGRYCDLMDAGDWPGVGLLFQHGRLSSAGSVLAEGAGQVAEFYGRGTQLHDGSPRTKHLVLNTQLSDGSVGVVVARSSYLVLQAVEGALSLQPIITGRYEDTFAPGSGGELRWHERAFIVDLVGDLSHHLTWTPPQVNG